MAIIPIQLKRGPFGIIPTTGLEAEPLWTIDTKQLYIRQSGAVILIGPTSGGGGASLTSGSVQSGHIGNAAVVSGSVASGSISRFKVASGSFLGFELGSGAIISGRIASGQVGYRHLADASVQSGTLASGAISRFAVASGSLLGFELGSGAIVSGRIASGQVGFGHLADASIQSGTLASGQISRFAIASGSFLGFELGSGAIVSGRIASGQVGFGHLADVSVQSGAIASGTIGTFHFSSGGVLSGNIASGQIGPNHLGSGAVLSGHVASGQVGQFHIASGSITSGRLGVANAPDGTKFLRDDFSWVAQTVVINSGDIGSGKIASGAVQGFFGATRHIASGTVGVSDLGSGAIVFGSVGSGAVASGNIASGQVGWSHLASGTVVSGTYFENYLMNGGMWFAQRQAPTTNTIFSSGLSGSDGYSADRWKGTISSGAPQGFRYQRWDRLTSGFASGADARFYGAWEITASGHKFVIYQPIEASMSQDLSNKTVEFQIKAKSPTSGILVRMSILQTVSGVTADTIPNSLVSGFAVETSGTDPTWGSGVATLTAPITIQLTNDWVVSTFPAATQSGHVNLIPALWANDPIASGTIIHLTEAGLYHD